MNYVYLEEEFYLPLPQICLLPHTLKDKKKKIQVHLNSEQKIIQDIPVLADASITSSG